MYKIETKSFGVKLTFEGFIDKPEMANWVKESESKAKSLPAKFGVFVDMRNLKPLPPESQAELQKGQKLYKMKGMERSVVIVQNSIVKMQFTRIAKETGIYSWERYIDASQHRDWEEKGIKWLTDAIDPDK